MSGTSGSSGLGSHNRLHIERRTVCMQKKGISLSHIIIQIVEMDACKCVYTL